MCVQVCRSMADGAVEGVLNCGCLAQKVSQENINMWPRDLVLVIFWQRM